MITILFVVYLSSLLFAGFNGAVCCYNLWTIQKGDRFRMVGVFLAGAIIPVINTWVAVDMVRLPGIYYPGKLRSQILKSTLFTTLAFLVWLMVSCSTNVPSRDAGIVLDGSTYQIIEYEGCEYIASKTYYGYKALSHKGNCKNPIHICK